MLELGAVSGAHPFVRRDEAEDSSFIQKLDAALIKVNVEVRSSGIAVVELLETPFSSLIISPVAQRVGCQSRYRIQ